MTQPLSSPNRPICRNSIASMQAKLQRSGRTEVLMLAAQRTFVEMVCRKADMISGNLNHSIFFTLCFVMSHDHAEYFIQESNFRKASSPQKKKTIVPVIVRRLNMTCISKTCIRCFSATNLINKRTHTYTTKNTNTHIHTHIRKYK